MDEYLNKLSRLNARFSIEDFNKGFESFRLSPEFIALQVENAKLKAELDEKDKEIQRLREALSEESILESIMEWKDFWMNQKQNSEDDYRNYLRRAMGVDANMKYNLAERISNKALKGGVDV